MHKSKYVKKKNLCNIWKEEIYGCGHILHPQCYIGKKLIDHRCCDDCQQEVLQERAWAEHPDNSRQDLH